MAQDYKSKYSNKAWYSLEWENADKSNLLGLTVEKQNELENMVQFGNDMLFHLRLARNNGVELIPESYRELAKDRAQFIENGNPAIRDNAEVVTTIMEESYVMDAIKARVYYEENIMAKIFAPVTSPLAKFQWDIKRYGIKPARNPVKFSRTFNDPDFTMVEITSQMDSGMGLYGAYSIGKVQLMQGEGQFFDLEYEVSTETARYMGRAMNEHIAVGTTSTLGVKWDDGGAGNTTDFTGFFNNANNQTFSVSTLTTYKNIILGTRAALADLKTVRGPGIIVCVVSAGILTQLESNYPTYGFGNYTEWDEWKRLFLDTGKINQVWTSDKCIGAAVTTSNQYMFLMKLSPNYMDRKLCLPLQTWSTIDKTYQEDVKEIMVVGDIIRFNLRPDTTTNPFPITAATSLTTTDTGDREETRVY